jgi:hypothetical protein
MCAFLVCILVISGFWASVYNSVQSRPVVLSTYPQTTTPYIPFRRADRGTWFFAKTFKGRFFTYWYPRRLGAAINWDGVLGTPFAKDLSQVWCAVPVSDFWVPNNLGAAKSTAGRLIHDRNRTTYHHGTGNPRQLCGAEDQTGRLLRRLVKINMPIACSKTL